MNAAPTVWLQEHLVFREVRFALAFLLTWAYLWVFEFLELGLKGKVRYLCW